MSTKSKPATTKIHVFDTEKNKPFSFNGYEIGRCRDFHNEKLTVWTDYKVYKRSSGYVCVIAEEAITATRIASFYRLHKAKNKAEVVKFMGVNEETLQMYNRMGFKDPQKLLNK